MHHILIYRDYIGAPWHMQKEESSLWLRRYQRNGVLNQVILHTFIYIYICLQLNGVYAYVDKYVYIHSFTDNKK
jgi:uncharacterized protein YdeI (YjbR/CyaY-like superfamily)